MRISPLVRGIVAASFVVGLCLGVWWLWTGGNSPSSLGEAPTRELDRLEREGVPELKLPRLDGTEFRLSNVHDKVILINFWASWCDPCVREFPSMLQLVKKLQGKLVLVAISGDENSNDVEKFLKVFGGNRHENVEIVLDPQSVVARQFGTRKLPESYVLDRNHRLVRKVVGLENWASAEVVEFMTEVFEGRTKE